MKMFILRRLFQTFVVLIIVLTILFALFRIMPGDPTVFILNNNTSAEERNLLLIRWGLNQPLWQQYIMYFRNFCSGDFGSSFYYSKPVTEVLMDKAVNSLVLMGTSIVLSVIIGGLVGTLCGWKRGGLFEKVVPTVVFFFRSVPIYWLGILHLSVFAFWLKWFPSGGMHSLGFEGQGLWSDFFTMDFLRHLTLPCFCALLLGLCDPVLIMRGSILDVLGEDYIEFARMKGLSEFQVMFKHGMRNAVLPLITYVAILIGFAFGGQVLLETVFSWPGMGRELVLSVERLDYPVCQAAFFFMSVVTIASNFVVDVLYGILDPRITYERRVV